jgi:hypothetical protein
MGKERPRSNEVFGLTEREQLWDKVSHSRFMALVENEQAHIHSVELSSNMYGEFLFVTMSRPADEQRISLTFYGAGYHEHRERWITDTWAWYETSLTTESAQQAVEKEEAIKRIQERQAEVAPHADENTQTTRGWLFEMLADMTDEDGALAEMDDLGDLADLFDDNDFM